MNGYHLVVHGEAVKVLLACRAQRRHQLIRILDQLAANPFATGDFQERDEAGREQEVKLVSGFILTYYADHAVKELRVTDIETP